MHRKPVVLLNAFDFYEPLLALVEHLRSAGFVRSEAMAALHVVTDASTALDVIEADLVSPNRGGRR
jgi:predicted Rossmann-fold nucleotide-binding protein